MAKNKRSTIVTLKYHTAMGNQLEFNNAPLSMGCGMLFLAMDEPARIAMLEELTNDHARLCNNDRLREETGI
jgi:hypothetical protein